MSILSGIWAENGNVVVSGPTDADNADASVLRFDRTQLDPATLPPMPDLHQTINGGVLDISKRLVPVLAVDRSSDWDTKVIAKTNLNNFGIPERDGQISLCGSISLHSTLSVHDIIERFTRPAKDQWFVPLRAIDAACLPPRKGISQISGFVLVSKAADLPARQAKLATIPDA